MDKNKELYKNKSFFITATNTDVGKTYACERFLRFFHSLGLKVGYFKPIETGVKDKPHDGSKMLKLVKQLNPNFNVTIDDVVPYQFKLPASPYVAKENRYICIDSLKKKKNYLQSFCDVLIIEGAGGLMVPIKENFFMIDLIKELDDKTFLITPSKLGCINDTLLSIEALKNKEIDFDFFINIHEDKESFPKVSLPFLENHFKNLYFLNDIR